MRTLHQQATLKNNLNHIYQNIDKYKKNNQEVKLLAVTKTRPQKTVQQAIDLGITCFGENKVQEAEKKFFNQENNIELHFIGHLQTNKVKKAVKIFDIIQTVDSLQLAQKINLYAQANNCKQRIYCQVNIGDDPKKFGVHKSEVLEFLDKIKTLKHLSVEGLMTILPFNLSEEDNINLYNQMQKLFQVAQRHNPQCKNLSMGMSSDYITAIQSGATIIRIGSGLFGERQ